MPLSDSIGHSSRVSYKWNLEIPARWVHKLHITNLEPIDLEGLLPGWAHLIFIAKMTYKTTDGL